jgi:hypothetical protein
MVLALEREVRTLPSAVLQIVDQRPEPIESGLRRSGELLQEQAPERLVLEVELVVQQPACVLRAHALARDLRPAQRVPRAQFVRRAAERVRRAPRQRDRQFGRGLDASAAGNVDIPLERFPVEALPVRRAHAPSILEKGRRRVAFQQISNQLR